MNLLSLSDWINFLLAAMQGGQQELLQLLAALHLSELSHGQAAWPFARRLSGDVLLIDRSVARQLLEALAFCATGLCLLVIALCWRRGRILLLLMAVTVVFFAPWPERQLLLAEAVPTSFHVSPSSFSADAIVHGQQLYAQSCASCHGLDGKGNTPLGLSLSPMPPNLASRLLWRRADGDLFWHIAHGMHDRQGQPSMPGFTGALSDADIWDLLDFMKANAAGASIAATGIWEEPVAFPAMTADCGNGAAQSVRLWSGQRLRVILAAPQQPRQLPLDDPRLHSLIVSQQPLTAPTAHAGQPSIDCISHSAQAWQALSIITAINSVQLAGTQLLVDRDGWLRARKLPAAGNLDWSDADILCRPPALMATPAIAATTATTDGLDKLIASMDATPVRYIKGGLVHGGQ